MNSQASKITLSLALLAACGTLNSCRLFGGGKYSSQTEVETEVPESLERGRASAEPPAAHTASSPTSNGVPATSNLIETDPIPSPSELAPLPTLTSTGSQTGGAPISSNPDSRVIDIPKPDFASVSVHNPRPPAQMLTLDDPLKSSPRMSAPASGRPYPSSLVKEPVKPAASSLATPPPAVPIPSEAELANAPKAAPGNGEAGVPLLHSGARLSDFYATLHQPLLDNAVVENNAAAPASDPNSPVQGLPAEAPAPAAPPAGGNDFAAPPPP